MKNFELLVGQKIVDFEGRFDKQGNLRIYPLPKADRGGIFEIAGINDKYHRETAYKLRNLILSGQHKKAYDEAAQHIINYTKVVNKWNINNWGVNFFLRDSIFNRGPTGALRILQIAVKTNVDGRFGPKTNALVQEELKNPYELIKKLRQAREYYERKWVKRDETSMFWDGLVNRWNKAEKVAIELCGMKE